MQGLTAESLDLTPQRITETGPANTAGAVNRIAHHRIAQVLHVHTDLMGAPGLQLHRQVGVMGKALGHPVMRYRRPSIADHRHPRAPGGMTAYGRIHGSSAGRTSVDDGVVFPLDLARLQRTNQVSVAGQIERHDQQSAGVLVQTMNDARARHLRQRRVAMQQGVLHR